MTERLPPSQALTTAPVMQLPALFTPTPDAGERFVEFFTANIRS